MRRLLAGFVAAPLVCVTTSASAGESSPVYVRVEAGGTANAAVYERTDATDGGRTSSVRGHAFGTALRAQIGYFVAPRFTLAAALAVNYISSATGARGDGDALATFGRYTQTSETLEATWLPAGGLRIGGSFGWATIAFPDANQDAFTETIDATLNGPHWGLLLGYDVRLSSFASLGIAARADFAHVVDDRADGHSSMTAFAPGVSVALMFR